MTAAQISFNDALEKCRTVVDKSFTALKQRFRQLCHLKLKNRLRAVKFIHACCVLHNLASPEDLHLFEPAPDQRSDPEAVRISQIGIVDDSEPLDCSDEAAITRRDEICHNLALARNSRSKNPVCQRK